MFKRPYIAVLFVSGILLAGLSACKPSEPTPPPRPTVIIVTAEGPYFEPFDDPSGWLVGESPASRGVMQDGRFLLTIHDPSTLAWTHQPRAFGDGVYAVDVIFETGSEASAFGLMLGGTTDLSEFTYVMVTADGRYDIGICRRTCQIQQSLIDGFNLSYAVNPGNQTNHLEAHVSGGQLTLLINGTSAGQVRGIDLHDGIAGLIGESSPYGGFTAAFDNLQVQEADSGAE